MGGKRSSRRGRGGWGRGGGGKGRGRGGNDGVKHEHIIESPPLSSAREPPAQQQESQHNNPGREEQSAAIRRPREPPTDCHSGNDSNEYRSTPSNYSRAGTKPVTRAGQNRIAASTTRRQDPPDETRSVSPRRSPANRSNDSNRDGRNKRQSNGSHFNHNEGQFHNNDEHDDSPLLDVEEQLQYEQYQDQHYHQQFVHSQQTTNPPDPDDDIAGYSSSLRQFTLAPLSVEMTSLNSKASEQRKAKKEERTLKQQEKAQQSQFSLGRYETVNSNHSSENESDGELDDFSYGDVNDESSEHGITRHEEFYNYDDDDDSDDEDEERPLRRTRSKLRQNRRSPPPPIMTRCETYQNRALVAAFALVALLFVRDHTSWWKKHKARVEYEKHHHHHKDGTDDDDSVRNVKLDPMAVYNSNDDDSTHTKDHDPLHKYVKEENKYNEHSAGERIAGRPAQKSMNHGFMDETYENRPLAKNSASTAAAAAGVRMDGSEAVLNEEESAFLKSVKGKAVQYSGNTDDGNRDQIIPPPPPIPETNDTPSDAASFLSSEVRPQSEDNLMQTTTAGDANAGTASVVEGQITSFSTEVLTGQQQQHLPPNEYGDNLVEWGGQQEQQAPLDSSQNIANILPPPINDPIVSPQTPQSNTFESVSSSSTGLKPMANDAMSGSAFMSNSLNAQSAQEIKDVYKNSYYRWNHSFRRNADEGDGRDVPVFWRIPRSASSTVEDVMSNCYHLAVASALGTRQGHEQDQALGIVTLGNARFVNVDMSKPAGIQRAKAMHLGASGMVDAISTPFLYETASIFEDVPDSGKCFTMLRHPVDRAVSLYYHYQSDDSNPNTAQYKGLSIDEYAEKSTESNWMVRFLTNKRAGALSWHDLEAAKEVFGRKCLVGLVEKAEESIRRYERFFGWGGSKYNVCVGERLANSDKRNQHESYGGTNAWEALRKKNEYDVLLYEYAKNLYTQQSTMYENFN